MNLKSARDLKQEILSGLAQFRGLPNGVAIGIAAARKATDYKIALRVREERQLDDPLVEAIRVHTAGEVDVRITGAIGIGVPEPATPFPRRLQIGSSIGHYRATAGTLGFFARRSSDGVTGLVSNNHVIALEDQGNAGDDVLNPAPADSGVAPRDVAARLAGGYPPISTGRPQVDCAFAELLDAVHFDPSLLHGRSRLKATQREAVEDMEVEKFGRTTGHTTGRVTAFELQNVLVDRRFGQSVFDGYQIEIEAKEDRDFVRPGDSGSLIFTSALEPVGLLFAASACGGAFNAGLAYANPLDRVLSALGVTLLL